MPNIDVVRDPVIKSGDICHITAKFIIARCIVDVVRDLVNQYIYDFECT